MAAKADSSEPHYNNTTAPNRLIPRLQSANSPMKTPLRILVLFTQAPASRIAPALQKLGYRVNTCPILAIEYPPLNTEHSRLLSQLHRFDDLIVTSQYAGERLAALLPKTARNLNSHWYAIGPASADSLIPAGVVARLPKDDFRTEGLLEIPDLKKPAGRQILLVQGQKGRPDLACTLRQRGAQVSILELYRRVPDQQAMKRLGGLVRKPWDGVLIGSGDALETLAESFSHKGFGLPLLVPSLRLKQKALSLGFETVRNIAGMSASKVDRGMKKLIGDTG